ncbi:MAG: hypothetical protein ACFCUL_07805 [Flavobacteriaceae bacterium]
MDVFDAYKNVIQKAVENDPLRKHRTDYGLREPYIDENQDYLIKLRNELPGMELNEGMKTFAKGMGRTPTLTYPVLGNHPDFSYLRGTNRSEDHWIISGFIDVRRSTQLFNKFTKGTVRLITESIVRASIFAVNLCGGYVHRIQGDGLMVYFGGKSIEKKEAVKEALKSFAMISYFVKNDLKDYFDANGIKDIHTRAGLDMGHSNQVSWFYSGIGDSGEITTCSLHTSLAPKMQSNAKINGIVVGHNVHNQLGNDKYFDKRNSPIHDYEDGRVYDQYNFDWERYLVDTGMAIQKDSGVLVLTINALSTPGRDSNNLYNTASKSKPFLNNEEL